MELIEWEEVRILIIDEISFMDNDQMNLLNTKLQERGDDTKVFGGFSIIFAGDFQQLQASGTSEDKLLFLTKGRIFSGTI